MRAVVSANLFAVLLPKVERPEEVTIADAILGDLESEAGLPKGKIGLIAAIENWRPLNVVSNRAVAAASLIAGINKNESTDVYPDLHAFVLESDDPKQEQKELWYYRLELHAEDVKISSGFPDTDADAAAKSDAHRLIWKRRIRITDKATGGAAAILSDDSDNGTIEVLVPEGRELVHYSMVVIDLSQFGFPPLGVSPFVRTGVVSGSCDGPAAFVELRELYFHHTLDALRPYLGDLLQGKPDFHALVPENGGLRHYWRMNFLADQPWQPGDLVAPVVSGPATMMETVYGEKTEFKPDLINRGRARFLTHNGNLDALMTIGDDLYFANCEFVDQYHFKWSIPVQIF